jgi:glycosyltransferase involved in cell wall biosynthesis
VIIPTFWTRRNGRGATEGLINVYDHPTPIEEEGTLADCLRSLEGLPGLGRVVLVVAATDPTVEHEAEDKVRDIAADFPGIDAFVFGPAELGSLHRRLEQLEFADMIGGVCLQGYGAVRNVGLIAAAVLGHDVVVFVDDDELVEDEEFLEKALWGLGRKLRDGRPVLAKSGYYVDEAGGYHRRDLAPWTDLFWRQADAFNEAMAVVARPPRLQRATLAFGGILSLHLDMYANVSFDPWVLRGEDTDYVVNARMHGADVFLDDAWSVRHLPPDPVSEAIRFRQDAFRFVYEHRKLEFGRSQVDLRQVSSKSLDPYPGAFIDSSVSWRAFVTGMLRAITRPERKMYVQSAFRTAREAGAYARENCQNYFEFQRRWPLMMERIWEDVPLRMLFTGERRIDRTTLTGRFPTVEE